MMKKLITTTVFGGALCFALNAFAADTHQQFNKFLNAEIARVKVAFQKKNIKHFEQITTSDFSYTDSEGKKEDKQASLEGLKQMFGMSKSIRANMKATKVEVSGNQAYVNVTSHFTIRFKPDEKGKSSTMTMTTWTHEIWKKADGKWKLASIKEAKPMKCMMDGKPFDPKQMGGHEGTAPTDPKKP